MLKTYSSRVVARHGLRHTAVVVHRWVGLGIALFLILVGLTGSLIAFNDELEAWFSPQLFRVTPPVTGAVRIDPFELRERVLQRYPGRAINWVDLPPQADFDHTVSYGLELAPDSGSVLANSLDSQDNQVFVNPYNGAIVGQRLTGDISQGWKNFMPFVYSLHYSLALGTVGSYVLGIVALLWTLDCFVGFYLTLPMRKIQQNRPSVVVHDLIVRAWPIWLRRWLPAWKLRWNGGSHKVVFDLHRAGGLWVWAMLFVFAWSSVGFNLSAVYQPVMRLLIPYSVPEEIQIKSTTALLVPPIGWQAARRLAAATMAQQAKEKGFVIRRERSISYNPNRGLYEYRTLSTLDVGDKSGNTRLFIDATDGRLVRLDLPTGVKAGNTVDTWLMALHTATVWGLPMQIFVSLMGGMIVILSVTGIIIWWRKYKARTVARQA